MLLHLPKVRLGLQSFITNNVLLVFFFAVVYYIVNHYESKYNKNIKKSGFLEWVHFSLVTQTTVGYGNKINRLINESSKLLKYVNIIQLFSLFGLLSFSI